MVLVDWLRGRETARQRLSAVWTNGDDAYVCAVCIEEVARGIHRTEESAFEQLLAGLLVAPLGIPEGRLAGWWRRTFARRGRTLSQADALIAAAAVGVGARVATANVSDFRIPNVVVEHWPSGI